MHSHGNVIQSGHDVSKFGIRLVCISDIHGATGFHVPDGDILIIAGDVCSYGKVSELKIFDEFLSTLSHPLKILVAGNHDWPFMDHALSESKLLVKNAVYLQDSGMVFYGLKLWGSPWQPWFFSWAFNLPRGPKLAEMWSKIPGNTDILITHSPPFGILDIVGGDNVGCEELAIALKRVRPKVHVFGHIHEGYGIVELDGTTYINASLNNRYYRLVNKPIVIDI
jgi:Icc-related predicted phosphoesterase